MATKKKISELPASETFKGLYTLGTDAQNRSVKVPLDGLANIHFALPDLAVQVQYSAGEFSPNGAAITVTHATVSDEVMDLNPKIELVRRKYIYRRGNENNKRSEVRQKRWAHPLDSEGNDVKKDGWAENGSGDYISDVRYTVFDFVNTPLRHALTVSDSDPAILVSSDTLVYPFAQVGGFTYSLLGSGRRTNELDVSGQSKVFVLNAVYGLRVRCNNPDFTSSKNELCVNGIYRYLYGRVTPLLFSLCIDSTSSKITTNTSVTPM